VDRDQSAIGKKPCEVDLRWGITDEFFQAFVRLHEMIVQKEIFAPNCTSLGGAAATNRPGAVDWSVIGP
jgi:hypothetical protein